MSRRIVGLVIAALALIGVGVAAASRPVEKPLAIGAPELPWMPHAIEQGKLTEAWFCPGIPASEGSGGFFRISNRLGEPAVGTVTLFNDQAENFRLDVQIPALGIREVSVAKNLPGVVTGAVIEVEGGGTIVEQVSVTDNGNSLAPCANDTATEWYLADGFTVDGSRDLVLLSNPYDQPVVAKLEFATASTTSEPRNMAIPARAIRVVDLGVAGGGAQGEEQIAVSVTAIRGRIVVGRIQQFSGGGRAGVQVSLASPAVSDQWRFAGGRFDGDTIERYSVYNPSDDPVDVEPVVLGNPLVVNADGTQTPLDIKALRVGAGEVVSWSPSDIAGFPEGDYAMVFSTLTEPAIVVERATTQTIDGKTNTSVVLGAIARPSDLYLATQWNVPAAPDSELNGALVIHNLDMQAGTLTVYAIGDGGAVAVPSLTDVALPDATSVLRLDLKDPAVIGRPLVIQTSNRVVVERWYRSGRGKTRTIAWAFPTG